MIMVHERSAEMALQLGNSKQRQVITVLFLVNVHAITTVRKSN